MDAHLGYEKHDPAGRDGGNSRNGYRAKTVLTDVGPVQISEREVIEAINALRPKPEGQFEGSAEPRSYVAGLGVNLLTCAQARTKW